MTKFLILMMISTSALAMSKEEAKSLYDLNKKVMNVKEIQTNYDVCVWQNELADIAQEDKDECIKGRNHTVDDTSKGDQLVVNTLKKADQMNEYQEMMTRKEFEVEMNRVVLRMQRSYGL